MNTRSSFFNILHIILITVCAFSDVSYCGIVSRGIGIGTVKFHTINRFSFGLAATGTPSTSGYRPSGYIPPELDPEYRKDAFTGKAQNLKSNAVKLNISDSEMATLPLPKEGDIVLFTGRWGDEQIGRIRFLQYVEQYETFFADIIPLIEGKSENVYILDKNSNAEYIRVDEIKPIRFYFVRAENGYKVYKEKKNPQKFVPKAAGYGKIDKDYNFRSKSIDFGKLESSMQEYESLKSRIITSVLKLGAAISVVVGLIFGLDSAIDYSIGVVAGALYLFLLEKKVDNIGSKYSALPSRNNSTQVSPVDLAQSRLLENASKGRLLIPVLVVALLTCRNVFLDGQVPQYLHLISQQQFVCAMSGFLTSRFSIFLGEVTKEIRIDDWIGLVPGSLAVVIRSQLQKQRQDDADLEAASEVQAEPFRVVFVTGPAAAGRHELLSQIVRTDPIRKNTKYVNCKLLTTNIALARRDSDWYEFVGTAQLDSLREAGDLVFEGIDRDELGNIIEVALSRGALSAIRSAALQTLPQKGKTTSPKPLICLTGPPGLLDIFSSMDEIVSTNIWVSLQTKEQFIERASGIVQQEATLMKAQGVESLESIARTSAEKVSVLVNEAARDINFYMQKAPLFDFTILNSSPGSSTGVAAEELLEVIRNIRQ